MSPTFCHVSKFRGSDCLACAYSLLPKVHLQRLPIATKTSDHFTRKIQHVLTKARTQDTTPFQVKKIIFAVEGARPVPDPSLSGEGTPLTSYPSSPPTFGPRIPIRFTPLLTVRPSRPTWAVSLPALCCQLHPLGRVALEA